MPSTAPKPDPKAEPEPTPAPLPETAPAPGKPGAVAVPEGRLPAGTYEFTGPIATQYLEVPLTARPADPGSPAQPATDSEPAVDEVPATPATVFDWPFSAPDDGRWKPVKRKPNQIADNAPPVSEE
jgi:hypothetical protein